MFTIGLRQRAQASASLMTVRASQVPNRASRRNPSRPCAEPRLAAKSVETLESPNISPPQHVVGIGVVPDDAARDTRAGGSEV
ncbi:MAG: hypothetical protein ABSC25_28090 [Roseiarcus sp.]|jgi:hypothetical protein